MEWISTHLLCRWAQALAWLSAITAILRRASKRICSRAKGMSYRGVSLRISMTLESNSEQHVG
jgi:hypothetical protein